MIPIETTRSTTEQLFGVTQLSSSPTSPTNTNTNEVAAVNSSTPFPWLSFLMCVGVTLAGAIVLYQVYERRAHEGRITATITKIPVAENTNQTENNSLQSTNEKYFKEAFRNGESASFQRPIVFY